MATIIAVYANWEFARIKGIGWGWAGVIWIYSIVTYFPLDILKFLIRLTLSGKAWDSMIQKKVTDKDLIFFFCSFNFFATFFIYDQYFHVKIDCFHYQEGLREGRERGAVGRGSTQPPWPL